MIPFWSKERREARAAQREERRLQRLSELERRREEYRQLLDPDGKLAELEAESKALRSQPHVSPYELRARHLEYVRKLMAAVDSRPLGSVALAFEDDRLVVVTDRDVRTLDKKIRRLRRTLNLPVEQDDEAKPRNHPPDHHDDPPWTGPLKFA